MSVRELSHDSKTLKDQLFHISQLAHHWKALVLLNEADVFVQTRFIDSHQNARVSIFLRKLEYNQEIMFLTINRVRDFDDAIQSRITLTVRYDFLSLDTRKQVWISFLKKAVTVNEAAKYDPKDLDGLARKNLNDRQIRSSLSKSVKFVNADHWFITDQKHDCCDSCVSRVSQHQDVYVSFGIDHQFERGIWIWFRWCWSSFRQVLLPLALTVANTCIIVLGGFR